MTDEQLQAALNLDAWSREHPNRYEDQVYVGKDITVADVKGWVTVISERLQRSFEDRESPSSSPDAHSPSHTHAYDTDTQRHS